MLGYSLSFPPFPHYILEGSEGASLAEHPWLHCRWAEGRCQSWLTSIIWVSLCIPLPENRRLFAQRMITLYYHHKDRIGCCIHRKMPSVPKMSNFRFHAAFNWAPVSHSFGNWTFPACMAYHYQVLMQVRSLHDRTEGTDARGCLCLTLWGVRWRKQMLMLLSGARGHRGVNHLCSSSPTLGEFRSHSSNCKSYRKVSISTFQSQVLWVSTKDTRIFLSSKCRLFTKSPTLKASSVMYIFSWRAFLINVVQDDIC